MRLEKFQRNAIFKAIVAGGLDPNDCNLTDAGEEVRILHMPSRSYFVLGDDVGGYSGSYIIGDSTLTWPYTEPLWATVPDRVRRWAGEVKDDADTPDLWRELRRDRELLTNPRCETVKNTPFSPGEQAEIATQIQAMKELVMTTYSLSEAQMRSLEGRLDDLQEAATRIGRKDWQLLFRGVMLTLLVEALLPPEAVQQIFVVALHALDHLFGSGGGTPELPGELPPVA